MTPKCKVMKPTEISRKSMVLKEYNEYDTVYLIGAIICK